ncbi:unnamed protein product, partial [Brassica rapa]
MKLSASCVFDLPEKDGRSKRRRFLKEDDYNEASVIRLFNTESSIPEDDEESSNHRIAFTGAIQV